MSDSSAPPAALSAESAPSPRADLVRTTLLLAVGVLLFGHAYVFDFVNDDAFISFRYADNLVQHGALVYNPGERVEGYTNFLWTLLIAGGLALGLDAVVVSKLFGALFGVGTLWVLARFMRQSEATGPSRWDALPGLLLALSPAFACWSSGGLETQLFTFTATAGWVAYLREQDPSAQARPLSGVYFAFAAMTRPEGMLFFGLTGLHRLVILWFKERRFLPTRRDWLWGIGFLAVFGPYFLWRYRYYGYPFPNTYYVKTGAQDFWQPGLRYLWDWLHTHLLWLWIPLGLLVRRALPEGRGGRALSLFVIYLLAVGLHVVRVGGDFMALHRFFVPLMPPLAVLLAWSVRRLAEALLARGLPKPGLALAGLVLAGLLGQQAWRIDQEALKVGSDRGVDSIGWLKMFAIQCTQIGQWIAENTPPEARLATTAAGTIPFYSRRYTYDVLLLNVDTEVVKATPARGNRPGHTKSASFKQVLDADIDWLIYHPTITERRPGKSAADLRAWRARGYEWFTVELPQMQPPWWGVWRRIEPKGTAR